MAIKVPWLGESLAQRYARQYGLLCYKFLKDATSLDALGKDFGANLFKAEVDYLIVHEWAMSLDDVIWRRTKHGLRLTDTQKSELKAYIDHVVYGDVINEENRATA